MSLKISLLAASFIVLIVSCSRTQKPVVIAENEVEAREDSLQWVQALEMRATFSSKLTADAESQAVESQAGDDAADDPAIWANPQNPDKSLILGTNKKGGLCVYNIDGKQMQFMASGRLNNVDLRDGFIYQGKKMVLVAASNRSINAISLYLINRETAVVSDTVANIPSKVGQVYGLCMYHNLKTNEFFAIVNGKDGKIEQWKITNQGNQFKYELTRTFAVATQPEGMVADDSTGMLYLGVEDEGVYYTNLNSGNAQLTLINESTRANNPAIAYDMEGLSLFRYQNQTYLVVSSQGNFTYALFNITNSPVYLKSFTIVDGVVDGTEETDGLDITTLNCGIKYPHGILVVQDGKNMDGDIEKKQNFKIISTDKIISILK